MQQATWTDAKSGVWQNAFAEVTDPVERAQILKRLDLLARLLDDAFRVPGTNFRIGWDGILGLVPGIGDTATTILSAYIVWEAKRLGVPRWTLVRMLANVGVDFLVGAVPAFGDLFDVAWKANRRNLVLLHGALRRATTWTANPARGLQPQVPRIA